MDYEKKYNEAMLRADEAVQNGCLDKNIFDIIFPPEESEDERIRKEIVGVIQKHYPNTPESYRWIAWLEEQKDKNCLACDQHLKGYIAGRKVTEEEKQKEQEPIQSDDEKEYVRVLKSLISDFIRDNYKTTDISFYQKIYDWLDGRHIEQKSAEWSEEDEDMRLEAIRVLVSGCERYRKESGCLPGWHKVISWLKSLRPQPKPEWSKEETKDLVHILKVLDDCYIYGKHDLSKTDYDNLTSTLKSLCPSWKPSEEQMKALNFAVIYLFSTKQNPTYLRDLYDDLLKLK